MPARSAEATRVQRVADAPPSRVSEPTPGSGFAAAESVLLSWTDDWSSTSARVRPYVREAGTLRPAGAERRAVIGRAGLGWGRGLHGAGAPPGRAGPVKREGDGRAPAGAFRLLASFGEEPPPRPFALPFTLSTPGHRCIDDPRSKRYGAIVDEATLSPGLRDWSSAERLRRDDALYRYLVVVDHNPAPATPGAGSCIFLHVWRGAESSTSGCTAMDEEDLVEVLAFAEKGTIFVQLPRSELSALSERWGLPPP